ncbi:MAG: Maltodextrin phosphorylase [Sodalis sp.]|nr:MAG: Maltodextrin phosphorylase [Sodalis sp.]
MTGIAEQVGEENIFIFGYTVSQVKALLADGHKPVRFLKRNEAMKGLLADWSAVDTASKTSTPSRFLTAQSAIGGDP